MQKFSDILQIYVIISISSGILLIISPFCLSHCVCVFIFFLLLIPALIPVKAGLFNLGRENIHYDSRGLLVLS